MPQNNRSAERGSALVYVFIGIALFAALLFTFSKGQGGSAASTKTSSQAKVLASQIITQGQSVKRAVDKLLTKGCSESQLVFYQPGPDPAANQGSPFAVSYRYQNATNGSPDCAVFDTTKGGAILPMNSLDLFVEGSDVQENWDVSAFNLIKGVGTDNTASGCPGCELLFASRSIHKEICQAINTSLGITGIPQALGMNYDGGEYGGVFASYDMIGDTQAPELAGKTSFCFQDNTGYYNYVTALIVR